MRRGLAMTLGFIGMLATTAASEAARGPPSSRAAGRAVTGRPRGRRSSMGRSAPHLIVPGRRTVGRAAGPLEAVRVEWNCHDIRNFRMDKTAFSICSLAKLGGRGR